MTDKEITVSKKTFVPEVVDDAGKPVFGPDLDAVLKRVTEMAQVAQLARIRQDLERDQFRGIHDPRVLHVTDQPTYLRILQLAEDPWISCFIINRGPDLVHIKINYPFAARGLNIGPGETRTIDHSKADERIRLLICQCDSNSGKTATLEVEGTY